MKKGSGAAGTGGENKEVQERVAKVAHVGRLDDKEVEALKKVHGTVHEIVVDAKGDATELSYGYLKAPERIHLAKAMSFMAQRLPVEGGMFLLNNCWIGGDERMKTDDVISFNAAVTASGLIDFRESTIKKR